MTYHKDITSHISVSVIQARQKQNELLGLNEFMNNTTSSRFTRDKVMSSSDILLILVK